MLLQTTLPQPRSLSGLGARDVPDGASGAAKYAAVAVQSAAL
jgi:hypothetical protein